MVGVGLAHLGSEGRSLVAAALKLGLRKLEPFCFISNLPNVVCLQPIIKSILETLTWSMSPGSSRHSGSSSRACWMNCTHFFFLFFT